MKHTVFLSLGSNLGDKNLNLSTAINRIAEKTGVLSAISSVYETQPWGFDSENLFYNMAIKIETELTPMDVLKSTQQIEQEMGRTQKTTHSYADRLIDIDIILYDDLVYQSDELTIPHPHYREREFVMAPLREIFLN
ncbi:MAG: 2-amino-4-hydroxy-6-hydroxymethyldihydropteridine diphosphokinase [Candidatus Symbiothrix sp.]|jgi:2-amino-4-hydroxy-6-hydroxymethyldihydropteridine diphosphokinase|nr:2-amino-4-hydroxy-6-hydroxymethyldihydropteridine diphosphokinase [Candidatus Symbiothrix sp.]